MQSDREACAAAGMNEHVGKPFNLNHLVAVLRQQVGRQQLSAPTPTPTPTPAPAPDPEASNDSTLPSAVAQAAALAGVNLEQALQFMAGQQELYERLLPMFLENLTAMPEQLQALLVQGDTQAASRLLHSLKGLAGQMGATALAQEAAKGEQQLAGTPAPEQAATAVEQACGAILQAAPGLIALQQAFAAQQSADVPTASAESLDRQGLLLALRALLQLLNNADMQALAAIGALQSQFAPALSGPLNTLASAINVLEFERAQGLCAALISEYGG
jgi:HPt (histidine-containing phosphotransfer) domain-containing protein